MTTKCPECGGEYSRIGQHWALSDCDYPEIGNEKKEVLTGILMGDGNIHKGSRSRNPIYRLRMVNKEYLEWLDSFLGIYSNGISIERTASESAELARSSGFRPDADEKDYSDIYALRTKASPEFDTFLEWYDTGEKVFPEIDMTPKILKHWYICDGTYHDSGSSDYMKIACSNESNRKSNIENIFSRCGFEVSYWNTKEYEYNGSEYAAACFGKEESERLFDWMGSPPPGFEYKWPEKYK